MINLNYKNHQFIDIKKTSVNLYDCITRDNFYLCLKCNNIFWYQDINSENYDDDFVSYEYFIYLKDKECFDGICNLSCEDLIVKNILE